MALTPFQQKICQLISQNRISNGESYIAGGVALNTALDAPRLSRDIDIFHDTTEALQASWEEDRTLIKKQGLHISVLRETVAYVEAIVSSQTDRVLLQWVRDSAYRFFPLIKDPLFGLTLHPFDLATNKVLALVGRLEIRDWIDVIESTKKIQPLGLLAWAASGKDPGFSPMTILNEAARSSHYTKEELQQLDFQGAPPDISHLSTQWKKALQNAKKTIPLLPSEQIGCCLINKDGTPFCSDEKALKTGLKQNTLFWHKGSIRGILPSIIQ